MNHHEGEVQGEPEDDEVESLPEVARDLASLRDTEQASAGSFFMGVNGGVGGLEWLDNVDVLTISASSYSSPEEPEAEPGISSLEGDVSGVSNGVFGSPVLPSLVSAFSYTGLEMYTKCSTTSSPTTFFSC